MYGIFINGQRPKSKKAIKEAVANGLQVQLENTSLFGNNYDGSLVNAPTGTYTFVGPDPFTKRNFYGNIVVTDDKVVVK